MNAEVYLFAFILGIIIIASYLMFTNDNTPEETQAMLDDEEMWP